MILGQTCNNLEVGKRNWGTRIVVVNTAGLVGFGRKGVYLYEIKAYRE